jgi:hypothetical protein
MSVAVWSPGGLPEAMQAGRDSASAQSAPREVAMVPRRVTAAHAVTVFLFARPVFVRGHLDLLVIAL